MLLHAVDLCPLQSRFMIVIMASSVWGVVSVIVCTTIAVPVASWTIL